MRLTTLGSFATLVFSKKGYLSYLLLFTLAAPFPQHDVQLEFHGRYRATVQNFMINGAIHNCKITITTCTYRRPDGLRKLLEGIARQTILPILEQPVVILVVDNEGSDTSREICDAFRAAHPSILLEYVVEPRRGISHARNAVLDNITDDCDFIAMIDDDEVPADNWLEMLLEQQQQTGAQIVRGPIVPVFESDIPAWLKEQEYFGWPGNDAEIRHGQQLDFASTNNTLVYWPSISRAGVRFNPDLTFTGGEDRVFFQQLYNAGNRIVYTDRSIVYEWIPDSRSSLPALLRLSYHLGVNRLKKQYYLNTDHGQGGWLFSSILTQLGKSLGSTALSLLKLILCLLTGRWAAQCFFPELMKISRGAGLFIGLFGIRYRYYR